MGGGNGFISKLLNNVFPRTVDFYGMLNDQVAVVVQIAENFSEALQSNDKSKSAVIRDLEVQQAELKLRNLNALNSAFSTPMDREEIYRAIVSIEKAGMYAGTILREMEVFDLTPDQFTIEMSGLAREGVQALKRGYVKLSTNPAHADEDAMVVLQSEANIKRSYNRALASLFDAKEQIRMLHDQTAGAEEQAMVYVSNTFKRREIYRHLFTAAENLAEAGSILHSIRVQIA